MVLKVTIGNDGVCVMKSGLANYVPDEYFIIQMDGRVASGHRRFLDALRAGLQLKNEFPQHDIKVRVAAEVVRRPVLNWRKAHGVAAIEIAGKVPRFLFQREFGTQGCNGVYLPSASPKVGRRFKLTFACLAGPNV